MPDHSESSSAGSDDPRRSYAAVRRTAVYRAIAGAWQTPVLLACSGGGDSMGLLVASAIARAAGRVGHAIVTHVDHMTRPGSAGEGRLVAAQASRFGLPFVSLDIEGFFAGGAGGEEASLREARYSSLSRAAAALGTDTVVTAHTLDDQIETVVLRLLSGSSPLAASGMRYETHMQTDAGAISILRPLLTVRRGELLDVLRITGTPFADDPSNRDTRFRRNRVRHELLPLLCDLEPGFDNALLRTMELARRDAEVVDGLATELFEQLVTIVDGVARIDRDGLQGLPPALSGRVLKMTIEAVASGETREFTFERVSAVLEAAAGRTGAMIELPEGLRAIIERHAVRIGRVAAGKGGLRGRG